jgi:hypothetical protein
VTGGSRRTRSACQVHRNRQQKKRATPVDDEHRLHSILRDVIDLPAHWHGAGTFNGPALEKLLEHASGLNVADSVETGTGKTTLLFSHLSAHHVVFAKDDSGDGDSLTVVRQSVILRKERVEFVIGPTQRTLANYNFTTSLQLVLIDGPHGYPFPDLEYYYLYPHISEGGLLILDDINIPTVFKLFEFLRDDRMFQLLDVVETTAFFKRTSEQVLDPLGDGWWLQEYNRKRFQVRDRALHYSMSARLKYLVPQSLKALVKRTVWSGKGGV